jgi:hypothetical protein
MLGAKLDVNRARFRQGATVAPPGARLSASGINKYKSTRAR